jgi:hypothetical protein
MISFIAIQSHIYVLHLSSVSADHQHFEVKLLNPMTTIWIQSTDQWNLFMLQSFCLKKWWRDTTDDKELQNKSNHTPIPFYSVLKCLQATFKTALYFACYFNMYIISHCMHVMKPTWCTIYLQFVELLQLYMFWAC